MTTEELSSLVNHENVVYPSDDEIGFPLLAMMIAMKNPTQDMLKTFLEMVVGGYLLGYTMAMNQTPKTKLEFVENKEEE